MTAIEDNWDINEKPVVDTMQKGGFGPAPSNLERQKIIASNELGTKLPFLRKHHTTYLSNFVVSSHSGIDKEDLLVKTINKCRPVPMDACFSMAVDPSSDSQYVFTQYQIFLYNERDMLLTKKFFNKEFDDITTKSKIMEALFALYYKKNVDLRGAEAIDGDPANDWQKKFGSEFALALANFANTTIVFNTSQYDKEVCIRFYKYFLKDFQVIIAGFMMKMGFETLWDRLMEKLKFIITTNITGQRGIEIYEKFREIIRMYPYHMLSIYCPITSKYKFRYIGICKSCEKRFNDDTVSYYKLSIFYYGESDVNTVCPVVDVNTPISFYFAQKDAYSKTLLMVYVSNVPFRYLCWMMGPYYRSAEIVGGRGMYIIKGIRQTGVTDAEYFNMQMIPHRSFQYTKTNPEFILKLLHSEQIAKPAWVVHPME
jgi:hypothetical protein